jgi:predicted RecA/RadA family phage recombinase
MPLTKDTYLIQQNGNLQIYPVAASSKIYKGAPVGLSSGNARSLVAADIFLGFADEQADNTTGTAGAINVTVRREGCVQLPITGVTSSNTGAKVYASADDTYTLTAGSNTLIGIIRFVPTTGTAFVEYDAACIGN